MHSMLTYIDNPAKEVLSYTSTTMVRPIQFIGTASCARSITAKNYCDQYSKIKHNFILIYSKLILDGVFQAIISVTSLC